MAINNPKNNPGKPNADEAETLEKIIQKLQAEGKIKPVTGMLSGTTPASDSSDEKPVTTTADEQSEAKPVEQPASPFTDPTHDDRAESDDEQARTAAVLSGWDAPTVPSEPESAQAADAVEEPAPPETTTQPEEASAASSEEAQPSQRDQGDEPKTLVVTRKPIISLPESEKAFVSDRDETPWTLQQFFNGEIDLDVELQKRFTNMPMMVSAKFRTLGSQSRRRVAAFHTADGSASLVVDADMDTKVVQLSFTIGSMVSLRFALENLSAMDRSRWLELMRRDVGGLAFLWGPTRWQDDYLICISRAYATNFYAFSPNNFEAAVRFTPSVARQLIDWLDAIWNEPDSKDVDDAPLLTW